MGFPFNLPNYSHKIQTKNSTIINLSNTGQDDTLGVLIRSKPFNDTNKNIELFKYRNFAFAYDTKNTFLLFSFSLTQLDVIYFDTNETIIFQLLVNHDAGYWTSLLKALFYLSASSKPFKDTSSNKKTYIIWPSKEFKKSLDIFWPRLEEKVLKNSLVILLFVKRKLWAIFLPEVHLAK